MWEVVARHASQSGIPIALDDDSERVGDVGAPAGDLPERVDGGSSDVRVGMIQQL